MKTTEHTIDAKGRTIGRVASDAAKILLAKNSTSVKKNAVADVTVRIVNAKGVSIRETKLTQKTYHSHSGYPGSDKATMLKDVIAKKGASDAIKRAVKGMLPPNTLRDKRMKHLIVEE